MASNHSFIKLHYVDIFVLLVSKKEKRAKKKRQLKLKKALQKKKARAKPSSSSSSSSSSDSSSSDSDRARKKKAAAKKKKKEKKRKKSSSDSTQSEDLFDVNILNNIKTERLTDDEKNQSLNDFSPRRSKPREIINVKELQNDFVGNNIHIKQEREEKREIEESRLEKNDCEKDTKSETQDDLGAKETTVGGEKKIEFKVIINTSDLWSIFDLI